MGFGRFTFSGCSLACICILHSDGAAIESNGPGNLPPNLAPPPLNLSARRDHPLLNTCRARLRKNRDFPSIRIQISLYISWIKRPLSLLQRQQRAECKQRSEYPCAKACPKLIAVRDEFFILPAVFWQRPLSENERNTEVRSAEISCVHAPQVRCG